jgi:hypothetical protein
MTRTLTPAPTPFGAMAGGWEQLHLLSIDIHAQNMGGSCRKIVRALSFQLTPVSQQTDYLYEIGAFPFAAVASRFQSLSGCLTFLVKRCVV